MIHHAHNKYFLHLVLEMSIHLLVFLFYQDSIDHLHLGVSTILSVNILLWTSTTTSRIPRPTSSSPRTMSSSEDVSPSTSGSSTTPRSRYTSSSSTTTCWSTCTTSRSCWCSWSSRTNRFTRNWWTICCRCWCSLTNRSWFFLWI